RAAVPGIDPDPLTLTSVIPAPRPFASKICVGPSQVCPSRSIFVTAEDHVTSRRVSPSAPRRPVKVPGVKKGAPQGRARSGNQVKKKGASKEEEGAKERAPSSQRRKREQRREQLLAVARDVFAKRGYARTSVDDIALEAGVARGTFYLYF